MPLVMTLTLIFAVTLIGVAVLADRLSRARLIRSRLSGLRRAIMGPAGLDDDELAKPFRERILRPLLTAVGLRLGRHLPARAAARANSRLAEAGSKMGYGQFAAIKLMGFLTVLLLFSLTLVPLAPGPKRGLATVVGVAIAVLAYRLPDLWLYRAIDARRRAIQRQLPDVLDLLCISVEAGLGFDGAIQKVAEKFKEPSGGEFSTYLAETRIGRSRADALRNLAARTGIADMRSFTAAVIQADQLGVSLTKVLRAQAESIRIKRKQRIQERAAQIPVKMLIPMAVFIFPTIFVVLVGPAAIVIAQTLLR